MALETELAYFNEIREELLSHHEGKYALVIGREFLGVYDHREEAYRVGIERRGNIPMLITQVLRDEPTQTVPTVVLGLLGARL